MLVGVAFLPPSFPPSRTCNRVYVYYLNLNSALKVTKLNYQKNLPKEKISSLKKVSVLTNQLS